MRKFRIRQTGPNRFWPEYTNGWWDFWHHVPEKEGYRGNYPEMGLATSTEEAYDLIEHFKNGKVSEKVKYPIIHKCP